MSVASFPPPSKNIFDDDDDEEGWQDMPVVREDTSASGLDEEDLKKYHYQASSKSSTTTANATGNLIDVDDRGNEWRSKVDLNENEYTRLRINEEEDHDEVHLRTRYLFDEDKAMTPLSQMQATKNLLTEAQRIAYVGLCSLTSREMVQSLRVAQRKELKASIANMELWSLKIMGRLYYHMELETQEQKMIESLAEHGVLGSDLVPALMATRTVANPEYDPVEARKKAEKAVLDASNELDSDESDDEEQDIEEESSISDQTLVNEPIPEPPSPKTTTASLSNAAIQDQPSSNPKPTTTITQTRTTSKVLKDASTAVIPGVSTSLSSTDENVTLDIRWTILCDLFLILVADSVFDARSRVLLEQVAFKLGLGWLDVVKFESRVTEALEIQEDIETLEQQNALEGARKAGRKRRIMMLGLATLGGGLVIGLSAGLLAPVIGVGLAGALTTVGVTGTSAFLGGTAGAAIITTSGVLTGSGIAMRGMVHRTREVRTFDILPLHNNKRVSCILTVPGFMNGINDDVRLPFSVLDPIVGDVFSVLWEPEMIKETGSALKILTGEVLSQLGLTVLQATLMTGLVSALQWPIILTKLGYLIDNPWSNALDRAKSAGRVLADVLIHRHLGVRPITLIGFSLGARVIFYALLELAKQKQFGIVQDVYLLGATLTMPQKSWIETRSVVSGRYVNAFARNDWVLNYLFRASNGTVGTVAGLRPIENVPGLENVDVTDKIAGHMSYRTFMPLILDQLGFPVFADFFDEPEEPDFDEDRIVVVEDKNEKKGGWFSRKKKSTGPPKYVSRPPSSSGNFKKKEKTGANGSAEGATSPTGEDDDLPPRLDSSHADSTEVNSLPLPGSGRNTPTPSRPATPTPATKPHQDSSSPSSTSNLPLRAGFDLNAIKSVLQEEAAKESRIAQQAAPMAAPSSKPGPHIVSSPSSRSHSTPPSQFAQDATARMRNVSMHDSFSSEDDHHSFVPTKPSSLSQSSPRSFSTSSVLPANSGDESRYPASSPPSPLSYSNGFYNNERDPYPSSTTFASSNPLPPLPDDMTPSWTPATASSFNLPTPTASTSTKPFYSPPSPPSIPNPFASSSTLSFGASDGSIIGTVGTQNDSWSIPPIAPKKKTTLDGYNANPWS